MSKSIVILNLVYITIIGSIVYGYNNKVVKLLDRNKIETSFKTYDKKLIQDQFSLLIKLTKKLQNCKDNLKGRVGD